MEQAIGRYKFTDAAAVCVRSTPRFVRIFFLPVRNVQAICTSSAGCRRPSGFVRRAECAPTHHNKCVLCPRAPERVATAWRTQRPQTSPIRRISQKALYTAVPAAFEFSFLFELREGRRERDSAQYQARRRIVPRARALLAFRCARWL